jgi:hypothetical protein
MRYTRKTRKGSNSLASTRKLLGLNKSCPPGQILRAPYTRKFKSATKETGYNVSKKGKTYHVYPKASSTLVKAACIKNRGLPGKGPVSGKGIGPLKEGELARFGYKARSAEMERHKALRKAIDAYGALSVFRKLDAVAKLTLRTAPEVHKIFVTDRKWIQNNFVLKEKTT